MHQIRPLFVLGLACLGACAAAPPLVPAPSVPATAPPADPAPALAPSTAPASATTPTSTTAPTPAPAMANASAPALSPAPIASVPAPAPASEIPPGTAVLHVGDSFALAGFAQALKPRMKALGVRYEVRSETSSFTTTWASKMDLLVANTQPDLVIINLGANEFVNTDPSTHAPAVRRIVKAIGDRPCVWVSPPSWRQDTGITDVIRVNSEPCRFYDSDALVGKPIPRQSDHIHPTEAGGAIWADAFWGWLNEQRAPVDPTRKAGPWRLKPAPEGEHRSRRPDLGT